MWTLKLLVTGVVFLYPKPNGADDLWLLLLDPGSIPGHASAHVATLTVDPASIESSRAPDMLVQGGVVFELKNEHLILPTAATVAPKDLTFAGGTRGARSVPEKTTAATEPSFQQQREDTAWVQSLQELVANVPITDGDLTATDLRTDVVAPYYPSNDHLLLARFEIPEGYIHTYSLWGEKGKGLNHDPTKIGSYCFKEKTAGVTCAAKDGHAVAEWVEIDIPVQDGPLEVRSQHLSDPGQPVKPPFRFQAPPGGTVTIRLSSKSVDRALSEQDIDAFYHLLKHPEKLTYLRRAIPAGGFDLSGACSPRKP